MIIETFRQAIQNVWSNKLRTFLTMLGIIIGVMAVIVIVGLGNGMTKSMRDSFSAMGTNTLSVSIWGYGSRTASVDDVYNIVKKNPDLTEAQVRAYCKENLTAYKQPKVVEFRTELPKTPVGKILRRELRDKR